MTSTIFTPAGTYEAPAVSIVLMDNSVRICETSPVGSGLTNETITDSGEVFEW